MIRPISTEFALFVAPFVLYAAFLFATRAGVLHPTAWTMQRVAALFIVSLALVIGSFLVLANFSGAPPNANYVPAHVENGQFVPGTTK
jgi:succinate dehydrogenase hydrophobic anchor subunit